MKFQFSFREVIGVMMLTGHLFTGALHAQYEPANKVLTVFTDSVFICEPDNNNCAKFELLGMSQLIFNDSGNLTNFNTNIDGFGTFNFVITGQIESRERNELKYFSAPIEGDGVYIFFHDEYGLAMHSFITKEKIITLKEKDPEN